MEEVSQLVKNKVDSAVASFADVAGRTFELYTKDARDAARAAANEALLPALARGQARICVLVCMRARGSGSSRAHVAPGAAVHRAGALRRDGGACACKAERRARRAACAHALP